MIVARYEKYDDMRYGRPWLAKIRLQDGRLKYDFLNDSFKGTSEKGGTLEADLEDGDYITFGQKDYLGKNSTAWIGEVRNGVLRELSPSVIKARLMSKEENNGSETDERQGVDGNSASGLQSRQEKA